MPNTDKLRKLVKNFAFYSTPSNGNGSAPCTVDDINTVIRNITSLLNAFIDEMEDSD